MGTKTQGVFLALKPHCVALSSISLREPGSSLAEVKTLVAALSAISAVTRSTVSRDLANYVFFPLKPLLVPNINEDISEQVFRVLEWLLHTEWFIPGGPMFSQLVKMFVVVLAKAHGEELRGSVYSCLTTLFCVAKDEINLLPVRPTLAHFATISLDERSSHETRTQASLALLTMYQQLTGDAAASFLPGTISSLTREMTKANQPSAIIVLQLDVLETSVTKAHNGEVTGYRTNSWFKATEAQVILALTPVLNRLSLSDYATVKLGVVKLCQNILERTNLSPSMFIEILLRTESKAIPKKHSMGIGDVLDWYIDAMPRILQGADEVRKLSMLNTMKAALLLQDDDESRALSVKLLAEVCNFVRFTTENRKVLLLRSGTDAPAEPSIEFLSADVQDALSDLLQSMRTERYVPTAFATAELFWISQKLGEDTYQYAVGVLPTHTDLALSSIIRKANELEIDFRPELMHILYPILALPQPSLYSLKSIAKACQYSDVSDMLVDNADYILNSINLAFVCLDMTPQTPKVLGLLLRLAPKLVDLIDDVVQTFFDMLDEFHGYSQLVEGIFEGLMGAVYAVSKQQPQSAFQIAMRNLDTSQAQDKPLAERFEEVKEEETSPRKIDDDEGKDKDSKSYTIVLQILQKAQIFLSHKDIVIKVKILELLHMGIPTIAQNEDKFLPFVHLCWPQLTRRLEDENPYVVAGVFGIIARMITFAGSFMRMRIIEDVIPKARQILYPERNRSGKILTPRYAWEGTARRKVADGLQETLRSVVEDGGLAPIERKAVLLIVEDLAKKSQMMAQVLHDAREQDALSESK